jgi:CCR4-NOT transcription complex subunit 7/8
MLKLIQLGVTLTDKDGNLVNGCTCWQFNFKFSLTDDIFAQDSIELLKTSGIDFEKFEKYGIDPLYFGELMMMSGLVLNDDIKWVSFHSKYDFAYLLKTLTCSELPLDENSFLELLQVYFPSIYDIKVSTFPLLLQIFVLFMFFPPFIVYDDSNRKHSRWFKFFSRNLTN